MSVELLNQLVKDAIESGKDWEGSADTVELAYLAEQAKSSRIKKIGEIGFNAGFSSYTFLDANPDATVVSFDLGEYDYVERAKELIDKEFPGRHELILGDSTETVPAYFNNSPGIKFDLIFIDGGHSYEVAKADIRSMKNFARKDTILLTDDLTPWKPWGEGPTKAWLEVVNNGVVKQLELYKDGIKVETIKPPGDRSWAMGKYIFD